MALYYIEEENYLAQSPESKPYIRMPEKCLHI